MPEITVLIPVRNDEKHVKESIDNVLDRTLTDFEFLIVDDDSTDRTIEIIQGYTDKRIRLARKERQLIQSLNKGLELTSGSYIAHMNAGDITHTERLRIQLKRMKENPDIIVYGTWAKIFSDKDNERSVSHLGYGIIHEPVLELLKYGILLHPSVIIEKGFLLSHHIEYQSYPCVEDYKLWFDIAKAGRILFVEPQEPLMFRRSDTQVTVTRKKEMSLGSIRLRKEVLLCLLSIYSNKTLNSLLSDFENLERNK